MLRKLGVAAEDTDRIISVIPPDVFHVGMENQATESADELDVVNA